MRAIGMLDDADADKTPGNAAEVVQATMYDKAPPSFGDGKLCFSLPFRFKVEEEVCSIVVQALETFLSYNVNYASYTKVNRVSLSSCFIIIRISIFLTYLWVLDPVAKDYDIFEYFDFNSTPRFRPGWLLCH